MGRTVSDEYPEVTLLLRHWSNRRQRVTGCEQAGRKRLPGRRGDPAEWRKGHDTQLESAVTVLMQELAKHPRTEPVRPAFPVYERCCGLDATH